MADLARTGGPRHSVWREIVGPLILLLLAVAMGTAFPQWLASLIEAAAREVGL